jgi:hypothetical protein
MPTPSCVGLKSPGRGFGHPRSGRLLDSRSVKRSIRRATIGARGPKALDLLGSGPARLLSGSAMISLALAEGLQQ